MKKLFAILFAFVCVFALVACGGTDQPQPEEDIFAKSEGTLTYAQYVEADLKKQVVVETFIQAKQGWWEKNGVGVATFYTQDKDGGYFLYNMPCSKDDYDNKLVIGAKIKVTGTKSEWAGEVEITDATYEVLKGSYIAKPVELTAAQYESEAIKFQNQFFSLKGLKVVERQKDEEDNPLAFGYGSKGTGKAGDDLYVNVELDGKYYTIVVESYLCGKDTDVYKAVEGLKIGDIIDIEGFMYWYETAQPHVTKVTVNK